MQDVLASTPDAAAPGDVAVSHQVALQELISNLHVAEVRPTRLPVAALRPSGGGAGKEWGPGGWWFSPRSPPPRATVPSLTVLIVWNA